SSASGLRTSCPARSPGIGGTPTRGTTHRNRPTGSRSSAAATDPPGVQEITGCERRGDASRAVSRVETRSRCGTRVAVVEVVGISALPIPRPGEVLLYWRSYGLGRACRKLFSAYVAGREHWYVTIEDLSHWVGARLEPNGLEIRRATA